MLQKDWRSQAFCSSFMMNVSIGMMLALQVSVFFVLRSHWPEKRTCSTWVMMMAELIKSLLSIIIVIFMGQVEKLFSGSASALVPTIGYSVGAMLSWWALPYVHASLAVTLAQLKLIWTALFSKVFFDLKISHQGMLALGIIMIGCIGMANTSAIISRRENSESLPNEYSGGFMMFFLGAAALVGESVIMGSMGVYMQYIFQNDIKLMWVRNVQMGLFSSLVFFFRAILSPVSCAIDMTSVDFHFILLAFCQVGVGILSAIMILYSGAVTKSLASAASIIITNFLEHAIFLHDSPSVIEVLFSLAVIDGIIAYTLSCARH